MKNDKVTQGNTKDGVPNPVALAKSRHLTSSLVLRPHVPPGKKWSGE